MKTDNLLIEQSPLVVQPFLATVMGLNEALFLQQVHYWLNNPCTAPNIYHGERWVYNTFQQWQEDNFPFFSISTLKRVVKKLQDYELLISEEYPKNPYDRTRMYRVNYENVRLIGDIYNGHG